MGDDLAATGFQPRPLAPECDDDLEREELRGSTVLRTLWSLPKSS